MKPFLFFLLLLNLACNKENSQTTSEKKSSPAIEADTPTEITEGGSEDPVLLSKTEIFMDLINTHRISIGVQALVHDEGIAELAYFHSENMAKGIVPFGHDGFSTRCSEGRTILKGGNLCGENVAMGQKTVQSVFTAWMNSPGHRSNIEGARYTHTGFGYVQNVNGTYYWTQIFLEAR